ncbi:chorismate synthase [Desulfitispora alkaliphila]|uniref:chorismate synthase n=1 Tax=Desulfitispora alkaliphila TaxID=622674 RepID=UPI003D23901E
MRYLTAGESHGKALTTILEGFPAGVEIDPNYINKQLRRRQSGYGRGGRMKIEKDKVNILSGIRGGYSLGSPIAMQIENKDWENWKEIMEPEVQNYNEALAKEKEITKPRPGHADLTGALKYNHCDMRNVLERASARETATRVAIGALSKIFLAELNIFVVGHVVAIGKEKLKEEKYFNLEIGEIEQRASQSQVMCVDSGISTRMISYIDEVKGKGDSLGGIVEVIVAGVPPGIGSYVQWDKKLDANISAAVMSIQAVKGVEIGAGFSSANSLGSLIHDEIDYDNELGMFTRKTNRAGGIEGGMSNGEQIRVRAAMKPIPTLYKPLKSVDLRDKKAFPASVERSDCCAVPSCAVVAEAVVAWEVAKALTEKFSNDNMEDIKDNLENYIKRIKQV